LALFLLPLFGQSAPPLPKGQVIPKVVCAANPRFSYALYLPTGYREDRPYPVLLGFSPSGVGEEPVRLFQRAAERFGWIVVGSNDSRNGLLRPAVEATDALWKDVNARFRVEAKRCASVGFSGGARMAMRLAFKHPKQFNGLISIGAFGTGDGLLTGLGHLNFFLVGGQEDFNHWELRKGHEELLSRRWKVCADRFDGGHRWPPEDMAQAALAFLQLGASRDRLIPADPGLEAEFRLLLSQRAEKAGSTWLAQLRWQELARLFPGTPEALQATQRLATLAHDPTLLVEQKLERRYLEEAETMAALPHGERYRAFLQQKLASLKQASASERTMIRRLLGSAGAHYHVAAAEAFEAKDWNRLLELSSSLAALDERDPVPCLLAAIALAQLQRPGEAILHLSQAQLRGYRKPDKLRAMEWLQPLKGQSDFEQVLKTMEPSQGEPVTPPR
ncbi:MAG: hypothetical protein WAT51_12655, partial [Holophaga sp.]